MNNREIAKVLREMAAYYEMEDVPFRPAAYERAADSLEAAGEEASVLFKSEGRDGLKKIPGVGEGIAFHIAGLLKKGTFPEYAKFRKKYPFDLGALTSVENIGPKTAKTLYEKLSVRNLYDLEKAAVTGRISRLPHFGKKTEENILRGIALRKKVGERRLLGDVLPLANRLEAELLDVPGVRHAVVAGSVRRRQETIGDLDFLVTTSSPEKVMAVFTGFTEVAEVVEHGPTKTTVRLKNGMLADVRIVEDEDFGAALQYFTGSKDHNVLVRKMAIELGLKLNEYGIWRGRKKLASKTEEDVYKVIGLLYIEPEIRTASGELEAARAGRLPDLIPYGSLRGDLQVQSEWTDGNASIADLAEEAQRLGREYIAITDHTKSLAMTGGLDERRLAKQGEEIDRLNSLLARQGKKFRVLKGTEVNILSDGTLDISDETLKRLDFVGASVHSHFNLSRQEQTKRIIAAMKNRHVDCIFHPTGRILNGREAYDVDMEALLRAAKETGTAMEIDAIPDRLDLKDTHVRRAVELGVKLTIDSDAHQLGHLQLLDLGVAVARRGWATKKDVLNTRNLEDLMKWLTTAKAKRK